MQTAEKHPVPRGRVVLAMLLWLFAIVLVAGLAWLFLRGCGLALPGSGRPLIALCSAQAMTYDDELADLKIKQETLQETLRNLQRRLSEVPVCAPGQDCDLASADAVVDVFFLQDLSASFRDDLPNFRHMIDDFIERRESGELGPNVRIGLGSFIDKPIEPDAVQAGDYAFKAHTSLDAPPEVLRRAAAELTVGYGGVSDAEAQFEAIVEMLGAGDSVGFRDKARKYVIVVTDAGALQAGDYSAGAPEDGVADGDPLNEDYPSATQVSELLREHDVTPIFLVAGGAAQQFYQDFVETHGAGYVGTISSTSDNLTEALFASLASACGA